MAGLTKTITIALVDNSLAITHSIKGVAKPPTEYFPVCAIKSIKGIYQLGLGTRDAKGQRKNSYPFTDMLMVEIDIESKENKISFDIQSVTNQPGWTPNIAGLNAATAQINTWAAECGGGGGDTSLLATEATQLLVLDFVELNEGNTGQIASYMVGDVELPDAEDISLNPAYVIAATTYCSIQIVVNQGVVTRGAAVYDVGVWAITAQMNKTLPEITLDASGSTDAFIEFMKPGI